MSRVKSYMRGGRMVRGYDRDFSGGLTYNAGLRSRVSEEDEMLTEAVDSLRKASQHKSGLESNKAPNSNWIEKTSPDGRGQLPAYIQHVALAIHRKRGVPKGRAIAIAIGVIKNWAHGHGNVDASTKAAAAKALAEWTALKAKAKALRAARETKDAVQESIMPSYADLIAVWEYAEEELYALAESGADYAEAEPLLELLRATSGPLRPAEHQLAETWKPHALSAKEIAQRRAASRSRLKSMSHDDLSRHIAGLRNRRDGFAEGKVPEDVARDLRVALDEQKTRRGSRESLVRNRGGERSMGDKSDGAVRALAKSTDWKVAASAQRELERRKIKEGVQEDALPLEEAWSEAARKAALEARRRKSRNLMDYGPKEHLEGKTGLSVKTLVSHSEKARGKYNFKTGRSEEPSRKSMDALADIHVKDLKKHLDLSAAELHRVALDAGHEKLAANTGAILAHQAEHGSKHRKAVAEKALAHKPQAGRKITSPEEEKARAKADARVKIKQIGGDDGYQYHVIVDGKSVANGLTRREAEHLQSTHRKKLRGTM